jgi:hypothetical protein
MASSGLYVNPNTGQTQAGLQQFRNAIINGGFDIWQRGTTFNPVASMDFSTDRWRAIVTKTNGVLRIDQSVDIPNLNFTYSLKFQNITSQATAVTEYCIRQYIEFINVKNLINSPITISFWYKSNIVGTHGLRMYYIGTVTGGVADYSTQITVNVANTWEYKTVTLVSLVGITAWTRAITDSGLALDIGFRVAGVGQTTININDYFNITGVQLEKGTVGTPFEVRPYPVELQLCQRYYEQIMSFMLECALSGGNQRWATCMYKVVKRAMPTVSLFNSLLSPSYSGGYSSVHGATIYNTISTYFFTALNADAEL